MSALGQKRTCAVHQPLSALPPIATVKADICPGACLLYPRKRTCAPQQPMSALGQKRTSLIYSITSSAVNKSFDGTVKPSALAACKLITNSYLVGCWKG